ncbi:MAG: Fe-S cluster assembly protein SufD [Candidatus Marinimicrobia bacterium]|nr:Fe-S cluster assembly protein SufD [Candidatus Neomarinimicrobiota bacterium]
MSSLSPNNFAEWINKQVHSNSSDSFAFSPELRAPSLSVLDAGVFPNRKDEEWRYTPLKGILSQSPETAITPHVDPALVAEMKEAVPQAIHIVFVNGEFSTDLTDPLSLLDQAGFSIRHISTLGGDARKRAEDMVRQSSLSDDNIFQHISLGLSRSGLFIEVENGHKVEQIVHVLHLSTETESSSLSNPVHVIRVGENGHLTLVEQYASIGNGKTLSIPAVFIQVEEGAGLDHYKIDLESNQSDHVSNASVIVAASGAYNSHQYLLGSRLTRSNVEVSFSGSDAQAILRGIYLGEGDQHLDVRTYMDHAYPHCTSHQHFRGIMKDQSRGVFNGMVLVRRDAQKTDAQQSNKNLLLSREARIDTKPQLEIYADDVKCAHGATVGELDKDALFYLQSRGIDKAEAELMLTRAFAAEITQEIEIESLQTYVEDRISILLNGDNTVIV